MEKDLNINVLASDNSGNPLKVIIEERKGDASKIHDPQTFDCVGVITLPRDYVSTGNHNVELEKAIILFDINKGSIVLKTDFGSVFSNTIEGRLVPSAEILKFGINSDKKYDNQQLASFIKMNRSFFTDKVLAMQLVSDLRNLKIKADKIVENFSDKRGSQTDLRSVAIKECNIPEKFYLNIPVFKGFDPQTIEVELEISPNDYSIMLVSAEAEEIMQNIRLNAITGEIELLSKIGFTCLELI